MNRVSTDTTVSLEKLGFGWVGFPPTSDKAGLGIEDRAAPREGRVPPRLLDGEYVGGGKVGIRFTFNESGFAGISRGL